MKNQGFRESRPPAVAGHFYPASKSRLESTVRTLLQQVGQASPGRVLALLVPHAGYPYSGAVAAHAFAAAASQQFDLIVILGANHSGIAYDHFLLYPGTCFETPLGPVEIDQEMTRRLAGIGSGFILHRGAHRDEHSIEVQLPFIRVVFPDVKFVPLLVGRPVVNRLVEAGKLLASLLSDRRPLLLASSDLSHYPSYEDARHADTQTLKAIESFDPARVHEAMARLRRCKPPIPNLLTCACGEGALLLTMATSKALGAREAKVLHYANSGDVAYGLRDQVVGYAAVAFTA